jgi:gas vesicle protein
MGMRAFVWGCAIGAALGVLFAPKRGEATRADLQNWFNERQGQAQDRLTDVREKAADVIEQGRQSVNTALDQAQRTTNLVADRAKEQVTPNT